MIISLKGFDMCQTCVLSPVFGKSTKRSKEKGLDSHFTVSTGH